MMKYLSIVSFHVRFQKLSWLIRTDLFGEPILGLMNWSVVVGVLQSNDVTVESSFIYGLTTGTCKLGYFFIVYKF